MPHDRSQYKTLQVFSGSTSHRSLADFEVMEADPGVDADIFGATDVGVRRDVNQDHFLVAALERSLFVKHSSLSAQAGTRLTDTPQGHLLIVADGIGGSGGGEVASAVAVDAMAHYAFGAMPWALGRGDSSAEELEKGLKDAVCRAQARMRQVAERKDLPANLGTTLTMAYLVWPELHLVHVGDSRAYLFRGGGLHRLTRDHTMAQRLIDDDVITPEEAAKSPMSHMLVNTVGGKQDEIEVELHRVELQVGDQLLLCTDGLYDMVSEETIAEQLKNTDRNVHAVVFGLIGRANEAGGKDNVTVVLARF